MLKYREIIEDNFLIDDPKQAGKLVPFKFNPVQEHYYEDLCAEYDIENKELSVPVRENILKARREGFSSLILAIFAADDIMQENPTESVVLSYKDDATKVFHKRYRTYVLSFFAKEAGYSPEDIQNDINILEAIAPMCLSIDSSDIELKHNKAHFQCQTAGARVGGRGGVMHKILFSEVAFYQDTDKIRASEMIEATMRQVDIASGWILCESTENGAGTYQYKMWDESKKGRSRFKNRFYGAGHFYTTEEIAKIKSEYIDMDGFRRDYPMSEDDLFKGTAKSFVTEDALKQLINDPRAPKELIYMCEFQNQNGIDVAEIIHAELVRLSRDNQGYALYVGIDEAKDIDATTVIALKGRRRVVGKGGVACIVIDTTRGDWLADWFEKNSNFYVKKVKFSRPSKSLMYSNLQIVIKDGLTSIPECKFERKIEIGNPNNVHVDEYSSTEHEHFWKQMMNLEKEIIGNMLVVAHPKGACNRSDHNYDECPYHDDYPDAWMMAEDAYFEINGVPEKKKAPVMPTVPDAVQSLLDMGKLRGKYRGGDSYE